MKKSTIWLLTSLMAAAFIGLLYMQIQYLDIMIKMRDDQFVEGVKRSLYTVSQLLEQDETRHFLEDDVAVVEARNIYAQYTDGSVPHLGGVKYRFTTSSGIEADLTIKGGAEKIVKLQSTPSSVLDHYKTMQEALKGQYLYQKGLLDQVILNIMSQSSSRPIEERADTAVVRKYLSNELTNNGLELPFEFAVVNRNGYVLYNTANYTSVDDGKNNMFVQTLFPNDPAPKKNYLKVYFPDKKEYFMNSIKFMIPSFALTLIIFLIFIYTIYLSMRQKRLSEMKNDFINNMTHEFKTPISSISLAAQMLNDPTVRKSPNMLQHTTAIILDETKRLRFQVEKVLQMSMFDRHKASLRLQEVDANNIIANIVKTFQLKVERYGGSLTANLDAKNAMVYVDEMHFTNVIFNLLDNAVKYRKEDVPPVLSVTTADIADNKLEIRVTDNGIGIKKENLKRVFERFYRVSTGNRHDVKGFGLGLAYVEKIVRSLKGEIRVESEINKGSEFIIILPLTKN